MAHMPPHEDTFPTTFHKAHFPWYAHLVGGYALTGAWCWLLVASLFWRNGRRRLGGALVAVNVIFLVAVIWAALRMEVSWWRLESFIFGLNLAWSMSAWLLQYRCFGPAPRRYRPMQWRLWVVPLATGVLLGAGLAVSMTVTSAVSERFVSLYAGDAPGRSSVLWKFFSHLPAGLGLGLLIGAWWAGCRAFRLSHVVSFLAGIIVVVLGESALFGIFTLIVHGGDTTSLQMLANDAWSLVPGHLQGWRRVIQFHSDARFVAWIPVGMLFGAPGRIRDFFKRAAVVAPLVILLCMSFSFLSQGGWRIIQGQVLYQTTSPQARHRQAAFDWLRVLLARYPDHAQWPHLAARLADYCYTHGARETSRALHRQIVHRYGHTNQWKIQADISRSILASPFFGSPSKGPGLRIPVVDYQDYLTQNWMALLSTVRYWEGDDTRPSDLLIRLREISQSEDTIRLPKLTDLGDLDDAAAGLGYGITILHGDPRTARSLIEAGIPVLLPVYHTFYLIYGFDDSRGVVKSLCFGQLSEKCKSLAVKEVQEILMLESKGQGRTNDRLARIALEADCLWHMDQWKTGRLADAAPWMAVIHPPDGRRAVAAALGGHEPELLRTHRGRLAISIALSYLDKADPVNCIRWARLASRYIDDPLVQHAAHLGDTLWQYRYQRIGSVLALNERFAVLNGVDRFMTSPDVRIFLDQSREQFAADLAEGRLSWRVRWRLLGLLDRHDARQRKLMISVIEADLAANPAEASQWRRLADLHALDDHPAARAQALAKAWSAAPQDYSTALAWARTCVLLDDPGKAEQILNQIDPTAVSREADYDFCLAAVAEWRHQPRKALQYYARAIDKCRFRAVYFQRYGQLLMAQGDTVAAQKALDWAARIVSGSSDNIRVSPTPARDEAGAPQEG
ncbi:MAG: hypothetical protein P8Z73_08595 [Desulfobacteraceae bacterium]